MVILIVLNILLIAILAFLLIYFFRNKNVDVKGDNSEIVKNKQNKKIKSDRVFVGRFVTDEEYQQMMNSRKSDLAILLEDKEREYEHLKELNK